MFSTLIDIISITIYYCVVLRDMAFIILFSCDAFPTPNRERFEENALKTKMRYKCVTTCQHTQVQPFLARWGWCSRDRTINVPFRETALRFRETLPRFRVFSCTALFQHWICIKLSPETRKQAKSQTWGFYRLLPLSHILMKSWLYCETMLAICELCDYNESSRLLCEH